MANGARLVLGKWPVSAWQAQAQPHFRSRRGAGGNCTTLRDAHVWPLGAVLLSVTWYREALLGLSWVFRRSTTAFLPADVGAHEHEPDFLVCLSERTSSFGSCLPWTLRGCSSLLSLHCVWCCRVHRWMHASLTRTELPSRRDIEPVACGRDDIARQECLSDGIRSRDEKDLGDPRPRRSHGGGKEEQARRCVGCLHPRLPEHLQHPDVPTLWPHHWPSRAFGDTR